MLRSSSFPTTASRPSPTPTFTVPNEVVTDSGDVKYRVGRLKKPLEGNDAKNGVLFKVGDLGIPDKTGKGQVVVQPCAVSPPWPDAQTTARKTRLPNVTRTVGSSMAECMIPMIVLGPKIKFEPAFDLVGHPLRGSAVRKPAARHPAHGEGEVAGHGGNALPAPGRRRAGRHPAPQGGLQRHRTRIPRSAGRRKSIALPPKSRSAGKIVKQVTAIASYRWKNRTVRTTFTARSRSSSIPPGSAAAWTASSTASWGWSPRDFGKKGRP